MGLVRKVGLCAIKELNAVQVAAHQSKELHQLLNAKGIDATIVQRTDSPLSVLEMDDDVDLSLVQSILDQWQPETGSIRPQIIW